MCRYFAALILVVLISCVVPCIAGSGSKAKTPNMVVQTDWLAAHLNDPSVVVLHVGRDRTSYDAGHIPNARLLLLSDIVVTRNGIPNEMPPVEKVKAAFEAVGVSNDKRVVLYGDMMGLLASRAYFTLDYLGVGAKAALLDGGLEKWKAESRPVRREAAKFAPAKLTIKARPELIVDTAQVQKALSRKATRLIDARPPEEFAGTKAGDGVPRPGHIPGAKNVFWVENLQSQQNPVLKPAAEMKASYERAGLKQGDRPIVYCRTGVQAAHDYFTLKMLGYAPVLYDESFLVWSNTFGTPVETGWK